MSSNQITPPTVRKRRPTGECTTRKTKHGVSYSIRVQVGGRRKSITLGTSRNGWTKKKAEAEVTRLVAAITAGVWDPFAEDEPEPEREDEPSFEEFARQWVAEREHGWAPNTRAAYGHDLTPLIEHFGQRRLADIDYPAIKTYVRKMRERRTRRGKPLKTETIRKTLTRLNSILAEAKRSRYIVAAPEIPWAIVRVPKTERPSRTYLDTAEKVDALLDAARALDTESNREHVSRHAIVATLVFSGLRISELTALRWSDVDLASGWLHVRKSKTDAGERRIKLRPALRDILAAIKPADATTALVFGTKNDRPMNPSNIRLRVLAKARERAAVELPPLTPHSLRRTFASTMLAIGVPLGAVRQEMGHVRGEITIDFYDRVMQYEPEQIEALRELVEGEAIEVEAVEIEAATR
jgi:integrase